MKLYVCQQQVRQRRDTTFAVAERSRNTTDVTWHLPVCVCVCVNWRATRCVSVQKQGGTEWGEGGEQGGVSRPV